MDNELTPTQKKFLRSAGRNRRVDVIIGKAGIGDSVLEHIRTQLAQWELLKVRLPALSNVEGPASAAVGRADAAKEIADKTGATLVDLVGRNVLMYRPNDNLPDEKRLHLP